MSEPAIMRTIDKTLLSSEREHILVHALSSTSSHKEREIWQTQKNIELLRRRSVDRSPRQFSLSLTIPRCDLRDSPSLLLESRYTRVQEPVLSVFAHRLVTQWPSFALLALAPSPKVM